MQTKPRLIGLTGGIGSGKSTVSRMLREQGASVVDADAVVRQLQERGQALWQLLFDQLGWPFFDAHGNLLRKRLASRLFSDERFRRELGTITHPIIRTVLNERHRALAAKGVSPIILDIPLLFESHWDQTVDEIWVVVASDSQQRTRIMARDGISEEEAQQRIQAQWPLAEKSARADRIIDNRGDLAQLEREVLSLWERVGG